MSGVHKFQEAIVMKGSELRRRLDRLGRTYIELAPLLGLSIHGLNHQMRGLRPVSRQTELLLEHLEERERRSGKARAH
jgi:hypothetical protein